MPPKLRESRKLCPIKSSLQRLSQPKKKIYEARRKQRRENKILLQLADRDRKDIMKRTELRETYVLEWNEEEPKRADRTEENIPSTNQEILLLNSW